MSVANSGLAGALSGVESSVSALEPVFESVLIPDIPDVANGTEVIMVSLPPTAGYGKYIMSFTCRLNAVSPDLQVDIGGDIIFGNTTLGVDFTLSYQSLRQFVCTHTCLVDYLPESDAPNVITSGVTSTVATYNISQISVSWARVKAY